MHKPTIVLAVLASSGCLVDRLYDGPLEGLNSGREPLRQVDFVQGRIDGDVGPEHVNGAGSVVGGSWSDASANATVVVDVDDGESVMAIVDLIDVDLVPGERARTDWSEGIDADGEVYVTGCAEGNEEYGYAWDVPAETAEVEVREGPSADEVELVVTAEFVEGVVRKRATTTLLARAR